MRLEHTVEALVKRPRSEITGPVVVFTVRVGKEISTEHWVICRSRSQGRPVGFVYSVEVVCESPKLSLEEQPEIDDMLLKKDLSQTQRNRTEEKKISLLCMHLSSYRVSSASSCDRFFVLSAS